MIFSTEHSPKYKILHNITMGRPICTKIIINKNASIYVYGIVLPFGGTIFSRCIDFRVQTGPSMCARCRHGGGLFWKLGGTTLVLGVGGIVGYAWYDDEFRTDFERDVLFGRAAMNIIMPYLPARDDVLKRLPW